jgi:hypothetical protein
LTGKSEGKNPFRKSRCPCNIKMGLKKIEVGRSWVFLTQNTDKCPAVVNMAINFLVSKNMGKFLSS